MLIASTFRCVEYGPQRSNFGVPKQIKIQVFGHSPEQFPLVSHQSWFTCQFELLLEVCCISASEAQFLGHFGSQNRTWFRFLVTSLFYVLIRVSLGVFLGVFLLAVELVRQSGLLFDMVSKYLHGCVWILVKASLPVEVTISEQWAIRLNHILRASYMFFFFFCSLNFHVVKSIPWQLSVQSTVKLFDLIKSCIYMYIHVCNWFYKLIHEPQKQIFTLFVLVFCVWKFEIWYGKVMELFSEIFVGTLMSSMFEYCRLVRGLNSTRDLNHSLL